MNDDKKILEEEIKKFLELVPEELREKVSKAFNREDIPNEEIQTTFEEEDEFYKASLEDPNVEVHGNVELDVEGIGSLDDGIGALYYARLTAPSYQDKNWIYYSMNGYNYCIKIGNDGSVLPNCVGYAWGRWRELLGAYHKLSRSNAENWWGNTSDGYERGQTPKVGAVICWRKGQAGNAADGAGHVAIVEKINSDGSILISQSAYNGTRFWTQTMKFPYNVGSTYHFQGFIYNPNKYDEEPKPEPKPLEKYNVITSIPGYKNSNDAANNVNSNSTVGVGEYYVFNKANNVINITKTNGEPGWWINPNDNVNKPEPTPTPQPQPETFKEWDIVVPTRLVNYKGNKLVQWDKQYTITELVGDRAVLSALRNGKYVVWAAMNTKDIKKV